MLGVLALAVVWRASSAPAQPDEEPEADLALGGELYSAWCVHCHGSGGGGGLGEGVESGPPVDDVDVRYVDMTLRTGRMPILEPEAGIISEPDFSDHERESLVAWMREEFDLPGELPVLTAGDVGNGGDLYATHCAACHGGGGVGGVAGGGATVRQVKGLDPEAIVEAMRVGPFEMPVFSEAQLSDEEAEDIASYVEFLSEEDRTPLGLGEVHRVTAAGLLVPLMIAVVGAVLFAASVGTKQGR